MANAVVGDDVYNDDPTVNKLQNDVAQLIGKEAAIFLTSGVQANLVSMMVLCQRKGDSVIIGDNSHIAHYERGGISGVGSIMPKMLKNQPNGTIDL